MEQHNRKDFGSFLRSKREAADISINSLARKLVVEASYISRVERGLVKASSGLVQAIADELGESRFEFLEKAGYITSKDIPIQELEIFRKRIDQGRFSIRRIREPDYLNYYIPLGKNLIMRRAEKVLIEFIEDFGPLSYTWIPIEEIAELRCNLYIEKKTMGSDILGELLLSTKTVRLNSLITDLNVYRYTLAHELGHWFLRVYDNFIDKVPDGFLQKREHEVDFFASCLLMPSNYVRHLAKEFPASDPVMRLALANNLQVSLRALEHKLAELGLVNWQKLKHEYTSIPKAEREFRLDRMGYRHPPAYQPYHFF